MKYRAVNKAFAQANGYFWLPCPLCGEEFGGHEWKDYDGLSSLIPADDGVPGHGQGICPDCTKAGRGVDIFSSI